MTELDEAREAWEEARNRDCYACAVTCNHIGPHSLCARHERIEMDVETQHD